MRTISSMVSVVCTLTLGLGVAPAVGAGDLWVTKTTDDTGPCVPGDCSLRAAVLAANTSAGNDTIHLPQGTFTLSIAGVGEDAAATGDLDLVESGAWTRVLGEGPGVTIIDAQGVDRVFHVLPGVCATFKGLTITGGGNPFQGGDGGGGIWFEGAQMYVESCEVTGNTTGATSGLYGGGINVSSASSLTSVHACTVSDNSATAGGGGYAVRNTAIGDVQYSTFSGNSAPYGGALFVEGLSHVSTVTISGNHSTEGATGVFVLGEASLQQVTLFEPYDFAILSGLQGQVGLRNCVIVGQCSSIGTWETGGGNVESPGDTCHLGSSDLSNVADTLIGHLDWNGGPTKTHHFGAGSVAVDLPQYGLSRDQRYVARPQDGNGDGILFCDAGALEQRPGELFMDGFDFGFSTGWAAIVR